MSATNGVGTTRSREEEQFGFDNVPPEVREVIANAPINLGAYGIYAKMKRQRLDEPWEIAAYVKDLNVFIDEVMHSNHTSGTRHNWRVDPVSLVFDTSTPHPQEARDYPWPDYQVRPHRTKVTEVTLERIYRKGT